MKFFDTVAFILLVIGGLSWGLVGIADFNFVEFIVGDTGIDRIVYILIGLSALWATGCFKRCCGVK